MNDEFPIITVEPDWSLDEEPMGSKNKFWLERQDDSLPWLFKYSRANDGFTTGEHWSEKLAAELAELLGVPHARVELAQFEGAWGSLSRMFGALEDNLVELVHGNEILAGLLPAYDPEQRFGQHQHTLDNILNAVKGAIQGDEVRLREAYCGIGGFVVLDALILNTDRHHENWALFRRIASARGRFEHWLAPSFDHASSLGREVLPSKLLEWRGQTGRGRWYAERGRGGVFWKKEAGKGTNPLQLAELAHSRWPEFVRPWLERLRAVGLDDVRMLLHRIPRDCMSDEHRWFVSELLTYTHTRLSGLK